MNDLESDNQCYLYVYLLWSETRSSVYPRVLRCLRGSTIPQSLVPPEGPPPTTQNHLSQSSVLWFEKTRRVGHKSRSHSVILRWFLGGTTPTGDPRSTKIFGKGNFFLKYLSESSFSLYLLFIFTLGSFTIDRWYINRGCHRGRNHEI